MSYAGPRRVITPKPRAASAKPPARFRKAADLFAEALRLWKQGGANAEAERFVCQCLAIEERPASLELLGHLRYAAKDYAGAAGVFRKGAEMAARDTRLVAHPGPWLNLGTALHATGELVEAEAAFRKALDLDQGKAETWANIGGILLAAGRQLEACSYYEQALALDPTLYQAGHALMTAHLASDEHTPEQLFAEHSRFASFLEQRAGGLHPPYTNSKDPERRLRVGFCSGDFKTHAVASFFEPLLHHRDRSSLEFYLYSELKPAKEDATTERIRADADHWRCTDGMSDEKMEAQIRADGIDVLVDLAGHTTANRLGVFARKPAPVSVTSTGYPHSTGMRSIDYRVVDAITDPESDGNRFASERLWRMEGCFLCYRPPENGPDVAPPPFLRNGFITFGSFNYAPKLSPTCLRTWAAILRAVPTSRLILKSFDLGDVRNHARILDVLCAQEGISRERIEIRGPVATYTEHLAAYSEVDIALDPWPYNGTTTTWEALWQGVPVVTLRGDRHEARVGASILRAIGEDCDVANTVEDYIDTAVFLATGGSYARSTKRSDVEASGILDGASYARRWTEAIRGMWRRYCSGEGNGLVDPERAARDQFIEFLWESRSQSRAQLHQDLWVAYELAGKRNGFAVEFGATDGRSINNTSLLEERFGWHCLLSEPNPVWHADLSRNRPGASIDPRAVWNRSGERLKFRATREAELGGIEITLPKDGNAPARTEATEIEVETVSLADLLEAHGAPDEIDFASIDTEGSELEILSAYFASKPKRRIRLIAVEHNFTPARDALRSLLEANGYEVRFPSLSRWDLWARLKE